jgi:hypothetical protein
MGVTFEFFVRNPAKQVTVERGREPVNGVDECPLSSADAIATPE